MEQSKEKIVERIQKLLRKADPARNNNPHETDAAMDLVNKLLEQHNISMMELGDWEEKVVSDVSHIWIPMGAQKFANFSWCYPVMYGVCQVTHCTTMKDAPSRQYCVIGSKEDIEVASLLYGWIVSQMKTLCGLDMKAYNVRKDHPAGRKFFNDWMLGCAERLCIRLINLSKNNPELHQLVRVTKDRNANELARLGGHINPRARPRTRLDDTSGAAILGAAASERVNIRKETALLS